MKVIIDQREEVYTSDYPDGWKFVAGDPFKFPVSIGNKLCFIKRFEQKSPEDISGWDLLVKMTGKYERTLSRVYDIKSAEEEDREIYYIFYEYLEGVTLDKYIHQADINLMHLNNDLFAAIRALQNYGFWFADFTEKNVFCQKDGTFVLVDVDSAQRISDLPVNGMYGSKDYWIIVLKFYKEILNKSDMRLDDINGISLNYLQVPFIILHLKIFLSGNKDDYNAPGLFNQLVSRLDKMVPEFRDIFLRVIENGKDPLSPEDISKIQDIVEKKIIKTKFVPDPAPGPVVLPVIKEFKVSSNEIPSGGTFTLSWLVENADKLELHKNGAMFQTLDISKKEVTLNEFADGTRQQSLYQLYAYKELAMAKSDQITIKLKEDPDPEPKPEPKPKPIPVPDPGYGRFAIIGVSLLVVAVVLYFLFRPTPKPDHVDGSLTANAGPDQTIQLPKNAASLDGSATAGKITGYSWSEISGAPVTIADPGAASTSATGLTKGTYQFQLKVTDDHSATALDTINVVVYEGNNIPPMAKASISAPLITLPKTDVSLSGTGTDADGSVAGYQWTKVSGPNDPTFSNSSSASTQVTNLIAGTYVFRLTATDNGGAVGTNDVQVTVNIPPTVDAGKEQTVGIANSAGIGSTNLDGSGSDPDANGRIFTYEWSQISGTKVTINDAADPKTRIAGMGAGDYEFQLKVTDADHASAIGSVKVTVQLEKMVTQPFNPNEVIKPSTVKPHPVKQSTIHPKILEK